MKITNTTTKPAVPSGDRAMPRYEPSVRMGETGAGSATTHSGLVCVVPAGGASAAGARAISRAAASTGSLTSCWTGLLGVPGVGAAAPGAVPVAAPGDVPPGWLVAAFVVGWDADGSVADGWLAGLLVASSIL